MNNQNNEISRFVETLLKTNRGYDFYVDWSNVNEYQKLEIELHAMDSLIRAKDIKSTFVNLLEKLPTVVATFPLLFALSKKERIKLSKGKMLLEIANYNDSENEEFCFSISELEKGINKSDIEKYYKFFVDIGLKGLFENMLEKSVIDYVTGVLVGLDTNGRKNRSGLAFENICEKIIKNICCKHNIEVLTQKKFKVLRDYNFYIGEDISDRKADFILVKGNKALNIEVNFYFESGSKPEEIVDSYINRNNDLKLNGIDFSLITDGYYCWGNEDKNQLNKAFRHISIMNYNMAKNGYLEKIIEGIFA